MGRCTSPSPGTAGRSGTCGWRRCPVRAGRRWVTPIVGAPLRSGVVLPARKARGAPCAQLRASPTPPSPSPPGARGTCPIGEAGRGAGRPGCRRAGRRPAGGRLAVGQAASGRALVGLAFGVRRRMVASSCWSGSAGDGAARRGDRRCRGGGDRRGAPAVPVGAIGAAGRGAARLGGRAHTVVVAGLPLDLGCGWLHSAERNPLARAGRRRGRRARPRARPPGASSSRHRRLAEAMQERGLGRLRSLRRAAPPRSARRATAPATP